MAMNPDRIASAGLTSEEATQILGIKPQTLYAYSSRGLIRKVGKLGAGQTCYSREDVEQLRKRQLQRRAPGAQAGRLAPPSIAVSSLSAEGPQYRGHLYRTLAVHPGRLESVAELLWTGMPLSESISWAQPDIPPNLGRCVEGMRRSSGELPLMRALSAAAIALGESAAREIRDGKTTLLARRAVMTFSGCLGVLGPSRSFVMPEAGESVAGLAIRALGCTGTPQELAALNSMLITCCEGGLTPATLAVRIAASTGAGLHACLLAGLGSHTGLQLGGRCDAVEDFFHWKVDVHDARKRLLRSGDASVARSLGFGHPAYPGGDPRGAYLLRLADSIDPQALAAEMKDLMMITAKKTGLKPSMEIGMVTLALALGLPRRSASGLWALGASVGWIAHIIDERLTGTSRAWASAFATDSVAANETR